MEVEQSERRRQLHADQPILEEAEVLHLDLQTVAEHLTSWSLTPKRILNSHLGLGISNVHHKTETDLRD
jgi:hypothetical protein